MLYNCAIFKQNNNGTGVAPECSCLASFKGRVSRGPMDKASAYDHWQAEDSRFESWRERPFGEPCVTRGYAVLIFL